MFTQELLALLEAGLSLIEIIQLLSRTQQGEAAGRGARDAYWRLWSLAEIIEENTESSPAGILFSDHLIHSWSYRFKYETESRSSVYIEHFDPKRPPKKLFDGLEEFLVAYAENPGAILQ